MRIRLSIDKYSSNLSRMQLAVAPVIEHCFHWIIDGGEDKFAQTADEMTRRGPRAKRVDIPGCGHAPALLDPEQIRIVTDWLGPAR